MPDGVDYVEVVLAEDLAPIIRRELARRYPCWEGGVYDQTRLERGENPLGQLANDSGVPERSIYRILSGESMWVDLGIADQILIGFDLNISLELPEDAFYDARQVREAVWEQARMLYEFWAPSRGIAIPRTQPDRKKFTGKMRRRWQKELATA